MHLNSQFFVVKLESQEKIYLIFRIKCQACQAITLLEVYPFWANGLNYCLGVNLLDFNLHNLTFFFFFLFFQASFHHLVIRKKSTSNCTKDFFEEIVQSHEKKIWNCFIQAIGLFMCHHDIVGFLFFSLSYEILDMLPNLANSSYG